MATRPPFTDEKTAAEDMTASSSASLNPEKPKDTVDAAPDATPDAAPDAAPIAPPPPAPQTTSSAPPAPSIPSIPIIILPAPTIQLQPVASAHSAPAPDVTSSAPAPAASTPTAAAPAPATSTPEASQASQKPPEELFTKFLRWAFGNETAQEWEKFTDKVAEFFSPVTEFLGLREPPQEPTKTSPTPQDATPKINTEQFFSAQLGDPEAKKKIEEGFTNIFADVEERGRALTTSHDTHVHESKSMVELASSHIATAPAPTTEPAPASTRDRNPTL